jgi:hypothetical protein
MGAHLHFTRAHADSGADLVKFPSPSRHSSYPIRLLLLLLPVLTFAIPAFPQASIFHIQSSPSPNVQGNMLNAVTAISATDAWAIGYQNDNNLNEARTLTMHWDGAAWKVVPSPNPGSPKQCDGANTGNVLNAISAVASNDAWAVGFAFNCISYELQPVALHWDGLTWKAVRTPKLRQNSNSAFNAVVALATDDVYAVGYTPAANQANLTLIEHWDGTAWSVMKSPNVNNQGNILFGISASSPTDLWAVGARVAEGVPIETLTEHFDGTQWSLVPSPNVLTTGDLNQNILMSVQSVAPNDVTAVGFVLDGDNQREITMIEHWNGTKWSIVPSPNQSATPGSLNTLRSLTIVSPTDMYAAGFFADSASAGQQETLVLHFDGVRWSIIPSPGRGLAQQLNGIFALSGTSDVWTVGGWAQNGTDPETGFLILPKTLILFSPIG